MKPVSQPPRRFPIPILGIITLIMFGFMYIPILVLGVFSFNASRYSARWEGFSLQWYVRLF
ncbi:MAG: hypothetical protein WBA43_09535, partial [Elainellaceae cyanobacterium]